MITIFYSDMLEICLVIQAFLLKPSQLPNPCWMEENINNMKSNLLSFLLHSTINCMTFKFFLFLHYVFVSFTFIFMFKAMVM